MIYDLSHHLTIHSRHERSDLQQYGGLRHEKKSQNINHTVYKLQLEKSCLTHSHYMSQRCWKIHGPSSPKGIWVLSEQKRPTSCKIFRTPRLMINDDIANIIDTYMKKKEEEDKKQSKQIMPKHLTYFEFRQQKRKRALQEHHNPDLAEEPQAPPSDYHMRQNRMRVIQSNSERAISKKIIARETSQSHDLMPAYLQRETRERQIISIKNANKALTDENAKLKSIINHRDSEIKRREALEKELKRQLMELPFDNLQELNPQEWNQLLQTRQNWLDKMQQKQLWTKITNLQEELQSTKAELIKTKKSIRCTSVNEIVIQNEAITQEAKRLRKLLQDRVRQSADVQDQERQKLLQQLKKMQKINIQLQQKNTQIKKQAEKVKQVKQNHQQMANQLKRYARLNKQHYDKMKEKDKEIESLRNELRKTVTCNKCIALKQENQEMTADIAHLQFIIRRLTFQPNQFISSHKTISPPLQIDKDILRKFLILRFHAHRITLEEVASYFRKGNLSLGLSIVDLLQIIHQEPFGVLTDKLLQTLLHVLCESEQKNQVMALKEVKRFENSQIIEKFMQFIGNYELMEQKEEDRLHIVASSLLSEHKDIFKALRNIQTAKRGLSESDFKNFFKDIVEEPRCIQYMVTQIILQSQDLEHLSIQQLFETFYVSEEQSVNESEVNEIKAQEGELEEFSQHSSNKMNRSNIFTSSPERSSSEERNYVLNENEREVEKTNISRQDITEHQ